MKSSETERTLTCDRCGAAVSPTGWPEKHVCISQSAPSPAKRCLCHGFSFMGSSTNHYCIATISPKPEAAERKMSDNDLEATRTYLDPLDEWAQRLYAEARRARAEEERLKVCVRGHHGPEAHDHE